MKTLVIAEAGVNHNGDLPTALRMIDVAADAGADVVKFQTFKADSLATRAAPKAEYQRQTTSASESQHEMLSRLELTPAMHQPLIDHCLARGIEFLSTGFDNESLDLLVRLGVGRLKVPSGEITNLPFLRRVAQCWKPVIMSSGMSTLDEVEAALSVLENAGLARSGVTVLHCTTAYPTSPDDVNLRAMLTIRNVCRVAVGYSDHTSGIDVSIAAVALGAEMIEKHFTLDRNMPGPDQKASLEPDELKALVQSIRRIEHALGDGVKRPTAVELSNRDVVRKSLVAASDIQAGDVFNEHNVTAKRPGTGLSPMAFDTVIGSRARRHFSTDEMIEL